MNRFHEIFRPEGKDLISLRKALDMDYELRGRLKQGGMNWSPSGAKGMLQIRSSIKSGRFYNDFKRTLQNAA
ncbi:MAG TPA: hypothetical protein ENI07_02990 [Desulfobacterales bacterium]|nr:hypothetical protein [Desulfobacterales bacterium]